MSKITEPASPRHRRRRRGTMPLAVGVAMLAVAGVWGAIQALAPVEVPDAVRSPGALEPTPTAEAAYDPVEQSEFPGEPVGDADGPYTMWIPRLDVRAPVVAIAGDSERVLLPPQDPLLGSWWRDGAAPGDERGSAVVVGHAVEGGESAFNDIAALQAGDTILMTGEPPYLWYRVSTVDVLPTADLAGEAEDLFAQDVRGRLVIVTCTDWDGAAFGSNVVVTAERA